MSTCTRLSRPTTVEQNCAEIFLEFADGDSRECVNSRIRVHSPRVTDDEDSVESLKACCIPNVGISPQVVGNTGEPFSKTIGNYGTLLDAKGTIDYFEMPPHEIPASQ
ncbi:uncharacterized protein LOC112495186 isoform X2 [Cephus cinctus]|uniref:Uncharacterized protein LOC112495186 isoform X2 n=1 Tax=Cephus cinctus TaxID=211228 RepID=A0AAJ7RSW1_CEPCN|nr:uncharacterized protein LOC112495186 isoform X2 [Cephus cinctus]